MIAIFVGFCILEIAAGAVLVNIAADRQVTVEARRAGTDWVSFLSRNIADLDRILQGKTPDVESIIFLEQAKQIDGILEFRLFDQYGKLQLISTELGNAQNYDSVLTKERPG